MKVDFLASQSHWFDHLAPVWKALRPSERGTFWVREAVVPHAKRSRVAVKVRGLDAPRTPVTVVAGDADRRRLGDGAAVLFQHGAGFSFGGGMTQLSDRHPSYAGGVGQDNVVMFLNPNRWADDRWRYFYPRTRSHIVGSPKMDAVYKMAPHERNGRPVVALTWHWECLVCPETRSAFRYYRQRMRSLLERKDIEVIGHCHPRMRTGVEPWFAEHGVEFVPDLGEVLRRADVYLNDSSSTLYEAAALMPVVVLNAPWFRRNVQHGLRFWDHADVGPQVDNPGRLNAAVDAALTETDEMREHRARVVDEVFPFRGIAAKEAAARIRELMEGR